MEVSHSAVRIGHVLLLAVLAAGVMTSAVFATAIDWHVYSRSNPWQAFWFLIVAVFWAAVLASPLPSVADPRAPIIIIAAAASLSLCATLVAVIAYIVAGAVAATIVAGLACGVVMCGVVARLVIKTKCGRDSLVVVPAGTSPKKSLCRSCVIGVIAFLAVIATIFLLLIAFNTIALASTMAMRKPMPGKLYDVDDGAFQLHVDCSGPTASATPTILIDTGMGAPVYAAFWSILSTLRASSRVCVYDRPGYEYSQQGPGDVSSARMSLWLKNALDQAGVTSPVLLVTFSLGGLYGRHFAYMYPTLVRGLVMIDSTSEFTFATSAKQMGFSMEDHQAMQVSFIRLAAAIAPLGVEWMYPVGDEGYTLDDGTKKAVPDAVVALRGNNLLWLSLFRETSAIPAMGSQVAAAAAAAADVPANQGKSLGAIPIAVVSAGISTNASCSSYKSANPQTVSLTCDAIATAQKEWGQQQLFLSQQSSDPGNTWDIVADAGHNVMLTAAGRRVILDRIAQVLRRMMP